MFTIEFKDTEVQAGLSALSAAMDDMTPVFEEIGGYLVETTGRRFDTGTDPDGRGWAANSPVTLALKSGTRPLIGNSKALSGGINHEASHDQVLVGSPEPYARMMQHGGTRAQFPNLWGDIPARPFLGVSEEDRVGILESVGEWLTRAAGGTVE